MADSSRANSLQLAHLVDIEHQLQQDEVLSRGELNERDGAIGMRIGARELDDRTIVLRWLEEVGGKAGHPYGRQVQRLVEGLRTMAIVLGLVIGLSTVAGWLSVKSGKPINSIHLWGALVGSQILLLMLWIVAIIPSRWLGQLPLAGDVQAVMRLPGRILPGILSWIGCRLSDERREAIAFVSGLTRQYRKLYGRLQLWLVLEISQRFAVALNIGFIVAFIALSILSDPAFGWRSTLLEPEDVHRAAEIIATPWWWLDYKTVPTLEEIGATEYSSLDQPFINKQARELSDPSNIWALWWGFILVSLHFYGLIPRVGTWLICNWRFRRTLKAAPLDHAAVAELRDRLRRPIVDTRAVSPDEAEGEDRDLELDGPLVTESLSAHAPRPCLLIACPGVGGDEQALRSRAANVLGGEIESWHRLTALEDVARGELHREIEALVDDAMICAIVEAWELPTGEYLDLIAALREAAGKDRLIAVLLYHRDPTGKPIPPRRDHFEQWRNRLRALGDPYLRIAPLIAESKQ